MIPKESLVSKRVQPPGTETVVCRWSSGVDKHQTTTNDKAEKLKRGMGQPVTNERLDETQARNGWKAGPMFLWQTHSVAAPEAWLSHCSLVSLFDAGK
jgi:hypothetical protein